MAFQTEFEFTLPMGFIGSDGQLYKNGTMRLATAMDEIQVLSDMRTRNNDAYVVILLLSRVITQLGPETNITASTIENLFAADLTYLQEFYRTINESGTTKRKVIGYPPDQIRKEVAYIAYFFHWQPDEILSMDHRSRLEWVKEIADINQRMSS